MKISISMTSLSSKASEKAKSLNLKHLGFGHYVSPKGKKYVSRKGELHEATDDFKIKNAKPVSEKPGKFDEDDTDQVNEDKDTDEDDEEEEEEEDEPKLYDKEGNRVDENGDPVEDDEEPKLYDKEGNRVNSDGSPYEEDEDEEEDEEGDSDEESELEEEVVPTPEHHHELTDASLAEPGTNGPVGSLDQNHHSTPLPNSSTHPSGSPDDVTVGPTTVRIPRTRLLVEDVRGSFGRTIDGYKGAIADISDSVKRYRPFKENTDDWELDDDGKWVDPKADEKAATKKKVIVEVGASILSVIGIALGPVGGAVALAVAIALSSEYGEKLDKELEDKDKENRSGKSKIKELAEEPAESTEDEKMRKQRKEEENKKRISGQKEKQTNAQDKAQQSVKSTIVRPGVYQFRKDHKGIWRQETRRSGTPLLEGNIGYVFVMNNKNRWVRYKESDFNKLSTSSLVALSGSSDAEIDSNLGTVIDDYKKWLKTLDLSTIFRQHLEDVSPEDLGEPIQFLPTEDSEGDVDDSDESVEDAANEDDVDASAGETDDESEEEPSEDENLGEEDED